jgi:hypothetical protein
MLAELQQKQMPYVIAATVTISPSGSRLADVDMDLDLRAAPRAVSTSCHA